MTLPIITNFDADVVACLKRLAKRTGHSKSYYIRKAVEENLEDLELFYLAQSRLEELHAGNSSTISWEEVKKSNGLQS